MKLNTELLKKTFLSLIQPRRDYRRYIHIPFLLLWSINFYGYLGSHGYNEDFKLWGTTFYLLPIIGFLIQIFYPTLLGWSIQTWINSVYLYNFILTQSERYVYNFPCKWNFDECAFAIQNELTTVAMFVIFTIFIIPGKEKRIINFFKELFIKEQSSNI